MATQTVDSAVTAWRRQRVDVAPHAVVRMSALPHPPEAEEVAGFARALRDLVECEVALRRLSAPLALDLYDVRSSRPLAFHREVVLPLRRDVHNRRTSTAALRGAVGDLPQALPRLAEWLAVIEARERLRDELADTAGTGLRAARAALARAAAAEPLRRAVALSSPDLLHGLDRAVAGGGDPGARARKGEAKILRYALRATTKTSPWSWFTAVGWGEWGTDEDELDAAQPHPVSVPNAVLVTCLVRAVLDRPALRARVAHRVAPALAGEPAVIGFRRDEFTEARRFVVTREQQVSLRRTEPLELVLAELRRAGRSGRSLEQLTAALAARLPDGAGRLATAGRYVGQLAEQDLLVPIWPIDPQSPRPLPALAAWLSVHDEPELAAAVRDIDRMSAAFAGIEAAGRGRALAALDRSWSTAFARTGTPRPEVPAVREDVLFGQRLALGHRCGSEVRADVARVAPLADLFDGAAVLRRIVRARLIDRFGPGGSCRLADLVPEGFDLWAAASRVGADGTITGSTADLPAEVVDLARLRREVSAAVRSIESEGGQVAIPGNLIDEVADQLPAWLLSRPSSHAYFVQPVRSAQETAWCLNWVGDGWGRYGSRFLDALGPGLREAAAAQVQRVLAGGRLAQYRPAAGFNANHHPLLVPEEIGEDPAWTGLSADSVEVVHDRDADVLRLRIRGSEQYLDVLYLGFMLQVLLPDRMAPLCLDLGASWVSLAHLAPGWMEDVDGRSVWHQQRLRHGRLVLNRRCWVLDAPTVADLVTALEQDGDVPFAAVAAWSAALGLPRAVFVSGALKDPLTDPQARQAYLTDPKPQFVDLGNPLHLRCLARLLSHRTGPVRIAEALPVPGEGPAGRRTVEFVVETYRHRS